MSQRVVWKFPVLPGEFKISLPQGAQFLSLDVQEELYGTPNAFMWLLVDPAAPKIEKTFRTVATGEEFESFGLAYRGTFQIHGFGWGFGSLVFHLFEAGA